MDRSWITETLDKIDRKLRFVIERNKNGIPAIAINGHYDNRADNSRKWNVDEGLCWWTNGFWGGIANQMYAYTLDKSYLEITRNSEKLLDRCIPSLFLGLHHDTGFMWLPLSVGHYMINGCEESRSRGLLCSDSSSWKIQSQGLHTCMER